MKCVQNVFDPIGTFKTRNQSQTFYDCCVLFLSLLVLENSEMAVCSSLWSCGFLLYLGRMEVLVVEQRIQVFSVFMCAPRGVAIFLKLLCSRKRISSWGTRKFASSM